MSKSNSKKGDCCAREKERDSDSKDEEMTKHLFTAYKALRIGVGMF